MNIKRVAQVTGRWKIILVLLALGVGMFPYSLNRIQEKGYDFPIYYKAGHGYLSTDFKDGAFVYNHKVAYLFRPLARLRLPCAFGVMYFLTLAGFIRMVLLLRGSNISRAISVPVGIVGCGSAFIILRLGNVAGLLALACLSPVGSVLAGCIKPYCFLFTLVHAARFCHRSVAARPTKVSLVENEYDISNPAIDSDRQIER